MIAIKSRCPSTQRFVSVTIRRTCRCEQAAVAYSIRIEAAFCLIFRCGQRVCVWNYSQTEKPLKLISMGGCVCELFWRLGGELRRLSCMSSFRRSAPSPFRYVALQSQTRRLATAGSALACRRTPLRQMLWSNRPCNCLACRAESRRGS